MAKEIKVKYKVDGAQQAKSQNKGVAQSFGSVGAAATVATAALVALAASLKVAVDLAAQQEVIFNRMANQLKIVGAAYEGTSKIIVDNFLAAMQASTLFGDTDVAKVLGKITQLTGDLGASMELTSLAFDLQAAGMLDANTAALLLSRAYAGDVAALGRYIPALKETNLAQMNFTSEAEKIEFAMTTLRDTFGGMARGETKTFTGATTQLKNVMGDLAERIGTPLLQPMAKAAGKITEIVTEILNGAGAVDSFTRSLVVLRREQDKLTDDQKELRDSIIDVTAASQEYTDIIESSNELTADQRQRLFNLKSIIDEATASTLSYNESNKDLNDLENREAIITSLTEKYLGNAEAVAENAVKIKEAEATLAANIEVFNQKVIASFQVMLDRGRITKEQFEDLSKGFKQIEKDAEDTAKAMRGFFQGLFADFAENQKQIELIKLEINALATPGFDLLAEKVAVYTQRLEESRASISKGHDAVIALRAEFDAGNISQEEFQKRMKEASDKAGAGDLERANLQLIILQLTKEQNDALDEQADILKNRIDADLQEITDKFEDHKNKVMSITQTLAGPFASALSNNIGKANNLEEAFIRAGEQLAAMIVQAAILAAIMAAINLAQGNPLGFIGNFGKLLGFSKGGKVPAGPVYAQGGTLGRGTDTVPAMLSPGELVIPAATVRENQTELGRLGRGRRRGQGGEINIVINNPIIESERRVREMLEKALQDRAFA